MAMSRKVVGKKLNLSELKSETFSDTNQSHIERIIANNVPDSNQPGEIKASSSEHLDKEFQRQINIELREDLDKSIAESYLEEVNIDEGVDETEGEIEFEQTSDSDQKHLYFGRASYRNIYNDPKKQEERNWITWETFSAISGMEVAELVRRAEVADLVLDKRGLARIRKRFTSMPKMYKRQFYRCGDQYIIPEQIPNWSEECKKLKLKSSDVGDDLLNRKVALMHGDITTLEVDAVVNSISSYLADTYEGVTKAIVDAASSLVYYELESIKIIFGGRVEVTAGYLLPAKYIFHTSGPTKHDVDVLDQCLKSCYINCLNTMVEMGLRTLAFCCVATGAKKVDTRHAANVALASVKEWLQENKDSVDKIIFCVYDIDNWASYQEWMPKIFPPGFDVDTPGASLLPLEILRMDRTSIELYKRALSEGKEAVHNIRVMVVGHYGVGKTTLTKRLFDEDVDINERVSTNGIDVHVRRCKVSLDTGQWAISKKGQRDESATQRLAKLLKQTAFITGTTTVENETDSVEVEEEELDIVDGHISIEDNAKVVGPKQNGACENDSNEETTAGVPISMQSESIEYPTQSKEEYILQHLNDLIDDVKQRSASEEQTNMAVVSVWDFAGQYAFYSTHQVFLSKRAVYLLVTDISKHVEDIVKDDDCFIDSKGPKHLKISEFVDFWLNSIHEFCSYPEGDGPPVVLVGTFADKVNQESKQETIDNFFYTLRSSLLEKATNNHLTEDDFVIDNSVKDENIELLKQQIVKVATSQPYWGELIPAKWITLENSIVHLKEDGLKVLHKDRLHDLNKTLPVPIETKDELELFLKFHHDSGNVLYYSDNSLNENIILDPQWLIDAFKSLITAKMFCCKKPEILKKWIQFDQSAILTRELVDTIWRQDEKSFFQEYEDLLLVYLEKLGLISKPHKQHDETEEVNYYFAPCMLKTSPPEELLVYSDCKNQRYTSVICFKTTSRFLPTAEFNKLLASCIVKWPIAKSNKKFLIFCGCGVFDLKDNHKLYLYFFDHIINVWITKLSTTNMEPDVYLCMNVYEFISDFLEKGMRLSSSIEVVLRCNHSDLHSSDNLFQFEDISSKPEVVCNFEQEQHVHRTNELTKYWLYSSNEVNVLTEKELNRMALNIGKEYQCLGIELGLSQAEIEHICLDYKTTVDRIRNMLLRWKEQNKTNATVDVLTAAMNVVGIDAVTVIEKAKENC